MMNIIWQIFVSIVEAFDVRISWIPGKSLKPQNRAFSVNLLGGHDNDNDTIING